MHRPSMIAGVLLTGGVLYALLVWAHAALVELRWLNPSESHAATRILVGPTGEAYEAPCAPGETCSRVVDLPPGENEVWIHQGDAEEWSPQSNVEMYTVLLPDGCDWDLDGNGSVTTADFGLFLPLFAENSFTVQDFGRYLAAMGTDCL
jgi:hypothetical protein